MSHARIPLLVAASLSLFAADSKPPATASELFDPGRVWSIHLTFTPEQWQAMEPQGGGGGAFGGGMGGRGFPGGGGAFGGPGGMRGRGGRGAPSPADVIAPALLKGDKNNDGKLSREEFNAVGDAWFSAWDSAKQGKITQDQLRAGIDATLPVPAGGGRGGPGRGAGGMQGQNGRNGMSAMMGIEFEYVHAAIDFNGTTFQDIAARYKGNSTFQQSRNSLKRSLKLEFNKYVKGQKIAGITKLNLHSNVTDVAYMNEPLSYRLFRDGKVPAGRTSYARVYFTVKGQYDHQYAGLYSLVEDVDNNFAQERFSTREGAIFKPSTQSLFSYLGDDWARYNQTYDPKTALTAAQKQRVIDLSKLVTNSTDAEFTAQIPTYLDLDEFARYLSINVWLANMDSILSMGQNFYLYLNPADNRFSILPWDLDLSFGGMGGSAELSIEHPWRNQNRFLDRLFKVNAFHKLYLARMTEFQQSIFQPERIARLVDQTAAVIRPAVSEESASKLAAFDRSVAGRSGFDASGIDDPAADGNFQGRRRGGGPGGRGGMPIKAFVTPRAQSVAAQLAGQSSGGQDTSAFGGRGGFGGPPGMGGPGMGGPGMGGPGEVDFASAVAPVLLRAMDTNQDGVITRDEFLNAFTRWFEAWGGTKGPLTSEQLRAGIASDLTP